MRRSESSESRIESAFICRSENGEFRMANSEWRLSFWGQSENSESRMETSFACAA